jgi:hypothetical protein
VGPLHHVVRLGLAVRLGPEVRLDRLPVRLDRLPVRVGRLLVQVGLVVRVGRLPVQVDPGVRVDPGVQVDRRAVGLRLRHNRSQVPLLPRRESRRRQDAVEAARALAHCR